jgi:hypothetical protein
VGIGIDLEIWLFEELGASLDFQLNTFTSCWRYFFMTIMFRVEFRIGLVGQIKFVFVPGTIYHTVLPNLGLGCISDVLFDVQIFTYFYLTFIFHSINSSTPKNYVLLQTVILSAIFWSLFHFHRP